MRSGRLSVVLAVLALVALLLAQGCGDDDSSTGSTETQTSKSNLSLPVSNAQVQRYEAGSPQRTTLEWWRAVQLNDPELARMLYTDPPTLPNLAGQFNFVAGQLDGTVKIASVKKNGKQAAVAIGWKKPKAPPRRVTIQVEREDGSWKIAPVRFLELLVQQMQKEEARASSG